MTALPRLALSLPLLSLALGLLAGCGNSAPQPDAPSASVAPSPIVSTSAAAPAPPPPSASAPAPVASAAVVDAGAEAPAASASAAAAAPPAPIVADNKVEPTEGAELQERARALFDAIVKDDPPGGDVFWFPKEPFIPLKDVKGPDKYWEQLHRTYASDIHAFHKKRKSWDGATFVKFEIGSTPKWVKPGDEANKIGYYRSFRGKLRYAVGGSEESLEVRVVITWQGRWYITHLRKVK